MRICKAFTHYPHKRKLSQVIKQFVSPPMITGQLSRTLTSHHHTLSNDLTWSHHRTPSQRPPNDLKIQDRIDLTRNHKLSLNVQVFPSSRWLSNALTSFNKLSILKTLPCSLKPLQEAFTKVSAQALKWPFSAMKPNVKFLSENICKFSSCANLPLSAKLQIGSCLLSIPCTWLDSAELARFVGRKLTQTQ